MGPSTFTEKPPSGVLSLPIFCRCPRRRRPHLLPLFVVHSFFSGETAPATAFFGERVGGGLQIEASAVAVLKELSTSAASPVFELQRSPSGSSLVCSLYLLMEIDHSDQMGQPGGYNVLTQGRESSQGTGRSNAVNSEERKASVHAEIERVGHLPSNSSYAVHRMRVLNKILNLVSVQQRSISQDEELELLFASLSL